LEIPSAAFAHSPLHSELISSIDSHFGAEAKGKRQQFIWHLAD
jgi:hypothetical protein